ncbi:MAG: hypothetical protein AB4368_28530 [Xenococcaceae cyanobacterium]
MKYIVASLALGLVTLAAGTVEVRASATAGLRLEFSNIRDAFSRNIIRYTGECPGEERYGVAEDGDLRFISHTTEPNKSLKVSLTNLRSGKRIKRDYKKVGLGSNDFNLTQLGNRDGSHEVEYAIYDKDTKENLETGTFTYNVTVYEHTQRRNGNWKQELYCATDAFEKLEKCKIIGSREVKYCQGRRTNDIRDRGIVHFNSPKIEININND